MNGEVVSFARDIFKTKPAFTSTFPTYCKPAASNTICAEQNFICILANLAKLTSLKASKIIFTVHNMYASIQ